MDEVCWPAWRLVFAGKATLAEIDSYWTIDDLAEANDLMDAEMQANAELAKQNQRGI